MKPMRDETTAKANGGLKIEKGILPRARRNRNGSAEFHSFLKFCQQAQVGDSALLTSAPSNYRMAALIAQVWLTRHFQFGAEGKQFRVWRIA